MKITKETLSKNSNLIGIWLNMHNISYTLEMSASVLGSYYYNLNYIEALKAIPLITLGEFRVIVEQVGALDDCWFSSKGMFIINKERLNSEQIQILKDEIENYTSN